MNNPRISVVIPCYEMHGRGAEFLEYSFSRLVIQSFKDFEVVVTDHSKNDDIEKLCLLWKDIINVKYFRNTEKIGSSTHNINLGMNKSQGEIIKLLFQDDYLFDICSLEIINKEFTDNINWLGTHYVHTIDRVNFFNEHIPRLSPSILHNLFGTPSAFAVRNKNHILFDENLIWVLDIDFYKRMLKIYGMPKIVNEVTMVNYLWEGQVSNTLATEELKIREHEYIFNKFKEDKWI